MQKVGIHEVFPERDPNDVFTGFYQDPKGPETADGSPRLKNVDFTGGVIIARYTVDDQGEIKLVTMFPNPDLNRNC
jgi:hypothetical protein